MFKMEINEVKEVKKVWGKEIYMANTNLYCGKKLILDKGKRCGLHYHTEKDETFYFDKGRVLIKVDGKEGVMIPTQSIRIRPGTLHRFSGLENSVIIEISNHHEDTDTYRENGHLSGDVPKEIMEKYKIK